MARVTVEDCLEKVDNRFALVILAAERSRQISKGSPMLVPCRNKPAVAALREIAGRFSEAAARGLWTPRLNSAYDRLRELTA